MRNKKVRKRGKNSKGMKMGQGLIKMDGNRENKFQKGKKVQNV